MYRMSMISKDVLSFNVIEKEFVYLIDNLDLNYSFLSCFVEENVMSCDFLSQLMVCDLIDENTNFSKKKNTLYF